jgi:hypothetical protein
MSKIKQEIVDTSVICDDAEYSDDIPAQSETTFDVKNSNLYRHAKHELQALGMTADAEEESNRWMYNDIMNLMEVFASQGHTGFTAHYCINIFEKLAKYKVLTPLTGEDFEWNEVTDSDNGATLYQNNRSSDVFKRVFPDGTSEAYYVDGKIFREPNGSCYTGTKSRVYITEWPYTPSSIYVDVDEDGNELQNN